MKNLADVKPVQRWSQRTGTVSNHQYLNEFVNGCKIGFLRSRGGNSEQKCSPLLAYNLVEKSIN